MPGLIFILFIVLGTVLIMLVLKISSHLSERLNQMNQQINQSLQEAHRIIGQNLGQATQVFGNVREELGRLEATNTQILEVSKNISSLQELLRAPKFRGQIGETFLENLLAQVLPKDYYQAQYRFQSGDIVDAIIKLGQHLVAIDAKFSLENFQRMLEASTEDEKNNYRRKFIQDVKNRIEEIAHKYILPEENTYDFALMYIPAENVYYETILKEDLLSYAMAKKVIPVSPNTFYAYLEVICLGLKGMQVEENAKAILKNLSALSQEISRFSEDFDTLGSHLSNASRKYDESQKRLERFCDRLKYIQETKQIETK